MSIDTIENKEVIEVSSQYEILQNQPLQDVGLSYTNGGAKTHSFAASQKLQAESVSGVNANTVEAELAYQQLKNELDLLDKRLDEREYYIGEEYAEEELLSFEEYSQQYFERIEEFLSQHEHPGAYLLRAKFYIVNFLEQLGDTDDSVDPLEVFSKALLEIRKAGDLDPTYKECFDSDAISFRSKEEAEAAGEDVGKLSVCSCFLRYWRYSRRLF